MIRVKYSVLSDALLNKSDLQVYVKQTFNLTDSLYDRVLKSKIDRFVQTHSTKFTKECHCNKKVFLSKNKAWLDREIVCSEESEGSSDDDANLEDKSPFAVTASNKKRLKPFENCSERSKRRRCQELQAITSEQQVEQTFFNNLRKSNQSLDVKIIKQLLEMSVEDKQKVLNVMQKGIEPTKYSPDEALALFVDGKMTKAQYELMAHGAANHNANIYPSYHQILDAKKQCYPDKKFISVTDVSVTIDLQALLDLTCERLVKACGYKIFENCADGDELTFIYKWGMDGASGQSQYKMIFKDCPDKPSDSSIIMMSLVPLAIIVTKSGLELWRNKHASSTKNCRPMKFLFDKESKATVQREYKSVQKEIDALTPSSISVNGRKLLAKHDLTMTMVDGKLINEINDDSDCNCNICGATPSQMNDFDLIEKLPCNIANFSFGISSLHCWIRFLECLLKIAFRLPIEKWKVMKENKDKFMEQKTKIQEIFRIEKGLRVSEVKQGPGSTNDGNTARRFFDDPSFSAKATGLEEILINRFRVILAAISSGVDVDVDKFKHYAKETAVIYKKYYNWYYMPPSVHKVLFHGGDIIASLNLPIGLYSEEAQEARNKDFKRIRQNHTRKMSRRETNEDIIHGLLVSSDPYISSLRKEFPKKEKPFDAEILQLLKC